MAAFARGFRFDFGFSSGPWFVYRESSCLVVRTALNLGVVGGDITSPIPIWRCPRCGFVHRAADLLRVEWDTLRCKQCRLRFEARGASLRTVTKRSAERRIITLAEKGSNPDLACSVACYQADPTAILPRVMTAPSPAAGFPEVVQATHIHSSANTPKQNKTPLRH